MIPKNVSDLDVYLYGMTVLSTIHLLKNGYPEADTYAEIQSSHLLPGGETANSAIILANLGYRVKIDGPFLGGQTRDGIVGFCNKLDIDCSGLYFDPDFEGVQDLVLIDRHSRTVFGKFQSYFSGGKRWTVPDLEAIRAAKVVSLDPFFGTESDQVATYCATLNKKYITIDCPPESVIHRNAAATVVSNEYIRNQFPRENIRDLLHKYTTVSEGLIIFTFGAREILYGRKNEPIKSFTPYQVEVKSTLGAGDTFRAGVVYGVLNEWDDENTVKFAAATAAAVCRRFPMALDPPGLAEIKELMGASDPSANNNGK